MKIFFFLNQFYLTRGN